MEVDIDDLLDEVEDTFVKKKNESKSKPPKTNDKALPTTNLQSNGALDKRPRKGGDEDLNSMIDDIFHEDGFELPDKNDSSLNRTPSVSSNSGRNRKCFEVYLGGSNCEQGVSTAIKTRVCNNLRCTDCDFQVVSFDHYVWHSSVDYLFLRNNIPDFHRLKSKLKSSRGSRAYACQCKNLSVKDLCNLKSEQNFKWFCSKH